MTDQYPVFISKNDAAGVLSAVFESPGRIFVIADTNTEKYCLPFLQFWLKINQIIVIAPGESSKSVDTCISLWREMLNARINRNDIVIGLGGGCLTDITGFVCSVFKRGISFYFFPTTLMGMADASLGGKNGIDFFGFKNMIGTITRPKKVIIYSGFLNTLPERELKSGYAEIVKHALISDAELWNELPDFFPLNDADAILEKSAGIKLSVVNEDEFDNGRRQILNFGHTAGHAIESFYLQKGDAVLHGEAIAAGMCVETLISKLTGLPEKTALDIIQRLKIIFHNAIPKIPEADELMIYVEADKKNVRRKLNFSLLNDIGNATYNFAVTKEQLAVALKQARELGL